MTFPINIRIGSVEIPSHFLFEMLSFVCGYQYYKYLRNKQPDPITSENRLWIFIGAAGGAFLFSRILGTLEDPSVFFSSKTHFLYYLNNKTIVGGLLGGLAGVEITKKLIGEKNSSGDLLTYPLILAMIVGRIGCFLAGLADHTYGNQTSLPWGIDFGDGITRHPTNLYEIIFLAILWLALLLMERHFKLVPGARFRLFLFSYLFFRLMVEFIKPDYFFSFGLSVIQLACLAGLLYYYRIIIRPTYLFRK